MKKKNSFKSRDRPPSGNAFHIGMSSSAGAHLGADQNGKEERRKSLGRQRITSASKPKSPRKQHNVQITPTTESAPVLNFKSGSRSKRNPLESMFSEDDSGFLKVEPKEDSESMGHISPRSAADRKHRPTMDNLFQDLDLTGPILGIDHVTVPVHRSPRSPRNEHNDLRQMLSDFDVSDLLSYNDTDGDEMFVENSAFEESKSKKS